MLDSFVAHNLAELVDEITDRINRGEDPQIDEYAGDDPQLREALEQIVATIALLHGPAIGISSDDVPPGVGQLGDFRLIRELGRGGMGVVYEAEQLSIGRHVALKVLPFAAVLDKQQLNRFKNEARAAGTLDHPNIVAIHSVGCERGVHYYAMQLIEGKSLAELIADMKPGCPPAEDKTGHTTAFVETPLAADTVKAALPTVRANGSAAFATMPPYNSREFFGAVARLGIQAAEALDHAHQNGILHRDIKPANLLIDCDGKLWITDFGLARIEQAAGLTMTGDLLGTLRYMSPEQSLAKRIAVDHRSDIYSLGVTLYELLTLRPAFTGDDRQELLRQIAFDEPRKPRKINTLIPQDLETIVLKAIDKNPADRFETAAELAADLQRFAECTAIAAKPPTHFDFLRKWIVRHAQVVVLACGALGALALILAAATALTLSAYRGEARQRLAAEENLYVASESIDRMLSRIAGDQYDRGDLAHAEKLAADATEFYEKLLSHSDDLELRYRAAVAHREVADIWLLIDKSEKALAAARRSIELVRPLIAENPREAKYLNARGAAYLSLGSALWRSERKARAQEPWHQAAADFQYLTDLYPHNPEFQANLAGALNNLGLYCWVFDRTEAAEECYKRVIEISDELPRSFTEKPEVTSRKACALSNWAMLRRERGDVAGAIKLLDQAKVLLKQSLDNWPTDPVAVDFLYNHYWQLAETCRQAGQLETAANTIDALVWAMPDRLDAYYQGAELLLECADLVETKKPPHSTLKPPDTGIELTVGQLHVAQKESSGYRQRARDMIAESHKVPTNTPERTDQFAWFLLTCRDESLRDPPRALELANKVVERAPKRSAGWLTLALARYRNGDWSAADEALQNSISLSPDGAPQIRHLLIGVMIRAKQGHNDEARQWRERARHELEHYESDDEEVRLLAAEAAAIEHKN